MDNQPIIADTLASVDHITAFDLLWAQRLKQIEMEGLLVYIIDNVSVSALPYLAVQFDVEGFKGYALATTDQERRTIIKQAIELKRYLGTVWAIKEAMRSLGYGDAVLDEGIDEGDPATDWAKFRVVVDLGNDKGLNDETASELARLIREYKNVRSHLLDISFKVNLTDTMPPLGDVFSVQFGAPPAFSDLGWIARYADGTFLANGSIVANEGNDFLNINIIPV